MVNGLLIATCFKCGKKGEYWEFRSLKEPVIVNGKELYNSFTYSKFFCPITQKKVRDKSLGENQEKFLIVDCMNEDLTYSKEKNS